MLLAADVDFPNQSQYVQYTTAHLTSPGEVGVIRCPNLIDDKPTPLWRILFKKFGPSVLV